MLLLRERSGRKHVEEKVSVTEIAWLAGLLEGEGSFGYKAYSPRISMQSTDFDVMYEASRLLGCKIGGPLQRGENKPIFYLALHGRAAAGWMMTLYTFMSSRRQGSIRDVLAKWKAGRNPDGLRAVCHPERPALARRLCAPCYQRDRRRIGGKR